MRKIVFQIDIVPDLSLSKYETLSDSGVEGVLERHKAFIRQWNKICLLNSMSMHLLYIYNKQLSTGKRMEVYFILQGDNEGVELGANIISYSPLGEYYSFKRVNEERCIKDFDSCTTLIKKERVVSIATDQSNSEDFYFVPKWEINEKARMYDLYKMFAALGDIKDNGEVSAYRIDLYPIDLSSQIQGNMKIPLKKLKKLDGYSNDGISLTSGSKVKMQKDEGARAIINEMEQWINKVETSPHFRVNIYGFSNSLIKARMLIGAVGAEAINEGDYSLLKINDGNKKFHSFSRMESEPRDYCTFEIGRSKWSQLKAWSTTYTYDEVIPFFRLPVLFEGEIIDIPKETAPPILENGMLLAKDSNNFNVKFPKEKLVKHGMICGVPGAGKTNTMLHLLSTLWTEDKDDKIPFLVFEPAKKEYRALYNDKLMKDVLLFSPKMGTRFPLRINPFQFPKGMVLSEHISTLMNVFSGSFELVGATYFFLDKSIEKAYLNLGWQVDMVNNNSLGYPDLETVYYLLEEEINASDYDGELRGNLKSFLQVRLGGLMKRDAGMIFNNHISTLSPEEWLYTPAIIELESLGEEDKNFLILLLCSLIMETLRVNPNADRNKKVRHAIFIEEAHNIISNTTQQSSDSVNPKISATAFIVKMLAEVRALREAIIITDQLPSVLAPEVMKNTGLKIVHRLTAQDDREMIGSTMSASMMQIEELSTYGNGQALFFYEDLQKPFKARVCKWNFDEVNIIEKYMENKRYIPMSDEELFQYLYKQPLFNQLIKEYRFTEIIDFMDKVVQPFTEAYFKINEKVEMTKYSIIKAEKDFKTPGINEYLESLKEKLLLYENEEEVILKGNYCVYSTLEILLAKAREVSMEDIILPMYSIIEDIFKVKE